MTTNPAIITNTPSAPNTDTCVIQHTMDQQLNYNLGELVKLIIGAFQDGTISTKNSERLQNLTIDDIVDLAVSKVPVPNLTSYITQNGTTIVEMIDSYNIIRDTKFVNSDYLNFKVITRRENDPSDPTGVAKLEIPYIQVKLPYDLINKDRIIQFYLTTKDETLKKDIGNIVIFEYKIDIDPIDSKTPFIMEARALNLDIGETQVIDVTTNPHDSTLWGTWSKEKAIIVSYLVDEASWFKKPLDPLPNPTVNYVAKRADSKSIPMTWGGRGTSGLVPNEVVNLNLKSAKIIEEISGKFNLEPKSDIFKQAFPSWIIIENSNDAVIFEEHLRWLSAASRVIDQKQFNFAWTPNPLTPSIPESATLFIRPSNKIISQYTYNLVKTQFLHFGAYLGLAGLANKIIEEISYTPIEIKASTGIIAENGFDGTENKDQFFTKIESGLQYPHLKIDIIRVPSWIINCLKGEMEHSQKILYSFFPSRIIEELKQYIKPFGYNPDIHFYPVSDKIINFLKSIDINLTKQLNKYINNPTRIINEMGNRPFDSQEDYKLTKQAAKIITENINDIKPLLELFSNPDADPIYKYTRVILQELNPVLMDNVIDMWGKTQHYFFNNTYYNIDYNKLLIYDPNWIVNQQSLYPMKMEVHSGSLTYIQDQYNLQVITSLNKEEFVPLITAEGKQQRSEYEYTAVQDQRVFNVLHNTNMVTVYRQGFKLSHGDYYSNGSKIILKSPANAGEVINIITERRYVFSNTVSKEELNNAINQLKTDRPIITYPATAFEKSTVELKIENYDPLYSYMISVKFEGKFRDNVVWVKRNNRILVDIPEISNVARKTISIIVYAGTSGRLQSLPTEVIISVKNLFDQGTPSSKLIIGTIPTEWYGQSNTHYTFDEIKSPKTEYAVLEALTAPYQIDKRIGINQNKWFQSKIIESSTFKGSFIDTYIGLENLPNIKLNIINSNGSETVIDTSKTLDELLAAFEKGTLYFIVDSSTVSTNNNYQIPQNSNYGNNKYSYRPAIEFTSQLNILPRSDKTVLENATWYIEHNNNLRGRYIRAAIILDFDFMLDFDFKDYAIIDEDSGITKNKLNLEHIKYQVQDEVPHLLLTINDPKFSNVTNPIINIGSKIEIPMDNLTIEKKQQEEQLLVNNLYAERIFEGQLIDLKPKDNTTELLKPFSKSKRYKKFQPFTSSSVGGIFESYYKKDNFVLNEDDINSDPTKSLVSLVRFFSDDNVLTDIQEYSIRVREIAELPAVPNSFRGIYPILSEALSAGSTYQADLAHIQYGGTENYIDDIGTPRTLIEQKYTIHKLYVSDTPTPQELKSGLNSITSVASIDSYHVINGPLIYKRIPTWWDVVLRPSVRPNRTDSLREVWELIRNNVSLTDSRWLKLTDGILMRPKVIDDPNLKDGIIKNHDVLSIPDKSQLFLFGGIGYKPITKPMKDGDYINGSYLTYYQGIKTDPDVSWWYAQLNAAYTKRGIEYDPITSPTGWQGRTDILSINYGWENNEPYVDYAWAKHYYYYNTSGNLANGIKFYITRVSREQQVNTDIYHLDLAKADIYNPTDNDLFPNFITKIISSDYQEIYKDSFGNFETLTTPIKDKVNFQDFCYDHNTSKWWLTIKPAFSKNTMLYNFNTSYSSLAGGIGILVSNYQWYNVKDLSLPYSQSLDPADTMYTKWSLLPDITNTLRGDGPILIKHEEPTPNKIAVTNNSGIYHFDTWNNTLYLKRKMDNLTIPISATFLGIPEITNIRNPYIIEIDADKIIEGLITLVGTRIYAVIYLDKHISKMTLEEFNLFREEILHIENKMLIKNPDKTIYILPNIMNIGIRTILPDGDDYRANSAQVILNRTSSQTGRIVTDLVFRITNNSSDLLEIENVRFQTSI